MNLKHAKIIVQEPKYVEALRVIAEAEAVEVAEVAVKEVANNDESSVKLEPETIDDEAANNYEKPATTENLGQVRQIN